MRQVKVCRYARRRAPRQKVFLVGTPIHRGARGETLPTGHSAIFLAAHAASLKRDAQKLGISLKEAHVRDDVIETMLHESMHATLASEGIRAALERDLERRGYGWEWARKAEEEAVDSITQEVMEEIREQPRLGRRP